VAQAEFIITIRVAWWVRLYLNACALFAATFGLDPDYEAIARFVGRGLTVDIE
jgi:hypothetical protein